MDFVAIDFETSNTRKNSACAVGIVAYEDGEEVSSFYSLIKPPGGFSANCTAIHGITAYHVASSPTAQELWPEIQHFFSPHWPIVAHNAPFDFSVLMSSFDLDIPDLWAVDTLQLCRNSFAGSHALDACAAYYGIDLPHHHNALDDARACAGIMQAIVKELECESLMELLAKNPGCATIRFSCDVGAPSYANKGKSSEYRYNKNHVSPRDIHPSQSEIAACALTGKCVVFTGEMRIPRREAMQLACDAGARIASSVSSKTDYLVCGTQDQNIVGEDGLSTKQEKAIALNAAGGNIKIITEAEYMVLLRAEGAEK